MLTAVLCLCLWCALSAGVHAQETVSSTDELPPPEDNAAVVVLYTAPEYSVADLNLPESSVVGGESVSADIDVIAPAGDRSAFLETIRENPAVAAAAPDDVVWCGALPDDPYLSQQTGYAATGADQVWESTGAPVKVALLDSGIDPSHEDLKNRVELSGWDYIEDSQVSTDPKGHGTAVAGCLAAETDNGIGIAGMAGRRGVTLVPYRVLNAAGYGKVSAIAAALKEVSRRGDIRIVNMSFGFHKDNAVLNAAVSEAAAAGKILVASTGNDNAPAVDYPACLEDVIAVGAVNDSGARCTPRDWGGSNGSNYGPQTEFAAPGTHVMTCAPQSFSGSGYAYVSGTSFAAPAVSAACAAVLAKNPDLSAEDVRTLLRSSAQDIGSAGRDPETGYGLIRLDRAEALAASGGFIGLGAPALTLQRGQSAALTLFAAPGSAVVWESASPDVAAVSADGHVNALAPGSAEISVWLADDPAQRASCQVDVVPDMTCSAHSQDIGWSSPAPAPGAFGTTGRSLRLEALNVRTDTPGLRVETRVHVANIGWMDWTSGQAGTTGRGLAVEALALRLSGSGAEGCSLYYRAHVQNYGWTAWAHDGAPAGTEGKALQTEAVEIVVLPAGQAPKPDGSAVSWTFLN